MMSKSRLAARVLTWAAILITPSVFATDSSPVMVVKPVAVNESDITYNYGSVSAQTPRTASQIGNSTGAADFNAGATSAQTLRAIVNEGVAASAANAWTVKPTDGTNSQSYTASSEAKVLVTPLTNSSVVKAQLQDNAGTAITVGQKAMASSVPVTIASDQTAIPVTQSTSPWVTSAAQSGVWSLRLQDGSGNAISSTSGALNVNVTNSFAAGVSDKSTFTYGTSIQNAIGGVFQDTSPSVTAGQGGAIRMTQFRAMHLNLRDSSGNELGNTNAAGIFVRPGDGTNTQGYTASNEAKVLVTPLTNSSVVKAQLQDNSGTALSAGYGASANGLRTDSQVGNTTGAADFNYGSGGAQTMRTAAMLGLGSTAVSTANPIPVQGDASSGATDSGNPLKIGGPFNTTQPTVTTGQRVDAQMTNRGAQIVATGVDNFNINNISGIVSLPTGAATLTGQNTGNASLSSIDGKIANNFGAASGAVRTASQVGNATGAADFGSGTTSAQTQRVVLATDQTAIPVTASFADTGASGSITAQDSGTTSLVASGQTFYFGTPTAGSSANFTLSSIQSVVIEATLLGAGGTMVIEYSSDNGTLWLRPNIFQPGTQNYTNGFSANFVATLNVGGVTNLRVRSTTAWTGSATITVRETLNNRHVVVSEALPPGANVIGGVNQGSANTAANAWFIRWTDATNTAAVKAASNAPVATDPAGVVVLSPNGNQATAANQATQITNEGTIITSLQTLDNIPHANDVTLNNGVPIMGQLDDTSTGTVAEDHVSTVRITAARGLHINLRNNAGTELGTTANPLIIQQNDSTKASYSASIANVTVAALPTDVFTITGSGTKTIRLTHVRISGTETTGAVRNFELVKRSTANSAGTSTTITAVPHDSNSAAATSTVRSYTANPTLGTLVGVMRADAWAIPATNLSGQNSVLTWDFGINSQEVILRGTSEVAAINFEGTTMAGNSMSFTLMWDEE